MEKTIVMESGEIKELLSTIDEAGLNMDASEDPEEEVIIHAERAE